MKLMEGANAIAEAAINSGCKFFAGYPMEPFTALLEAFASQMPAAGEVCIAAQSEIEGVNMAIGAATTGARAATGSCGQGIALMQEAIAEAALNEIPLVVFNMARGQQDYFQATRGGGWGDYRTITYAPKSVSEAVSHTHALFHLADLYRTPTLLYGDYIIAGTHMSVDTAAPQLGLLPDKSWAIDGSLGGTPSARVSWTVRWGRPQSPGPGANVHWQTVAAKYDSLARLEAKHEAIHTDDCDVIVVSFGTTALFVEHAIDRLRGEGYRVGAFRPITLWPFPHAALEAATERVSRILVLELNAGQMIDDVLLSVNDRGKVIGIGGISQDSGGGMKQGGMLEADEITRRIRKAIDAPT